MRAIERVRSALRRPNSVDRTLRFFQSGEVEGINVDAVKGPLTFDFQSSLGKPLPAIKVDGSFTHLNPSTSIQKRGFLRRRVNVAFFPHKPTSKTEQSGGPHGIYRSYPKSLTSPEMIVFAALSSRKSAEENILSVAATAREQINNQLPVASVKPLPRDASGSLI